MPNSAVPFTGSTGKFGAVLKAAASSGDLDTLFGTLRVYDIRDSAHPAVGDDSTDCSPAVQDAVDAAIAAGGAGPIIVYFPPTTSFWRLKTAIVKDTGSHTDFANVRQILFVGEGDAGPVRIDCDLSTDVFDLDAGQGQTAYRDFLGGFYNMTFVTSNDSAYVKGVDCRNLFVIGNSDTARWDFSNVKLVGIWAHDNVLNLEGGGFRFDGFYVNGGFAGASGGQSIAVLNTWALLEGKDIYVNADAHFRGTTWTGGGVQYSAFFEVQVPQDYDSIIALDRFFGDVACSRIVWCNQANYSTTNRVRKITAKNAVTLIGASPTFDVAYCAAVEIDGVEFELGTGSVFINGTNCDDVRLRNVRATYTGTTMHGVFDNTCKSVLVDECDLGSDSPFPWGVSSDAAVTRLIKGGVKYFIRNIGSVYIRTDGDESTWYQPCALAESYTAGISVITGDYTVANDLMATKKGMQVAGVRFYWDGSSATTIRCSLWDYNGSRVTYVDFAVPATAGIYEAFFATPQLLSPYKQYMVSTRESGGTRALYMASGAVSSATGGVIVYADLFKKPVSNALVRYSGYYHFGGDAYPGSIDSTELWLVEPLLS